PLTIRLIAFALTNVAALASGEPALSGGSAPSPSEMVLGQAAFPVVDYNIWVQDFLSHIMPAIAGFVPTVSTIVMVRFNARANPAPSRTTHNTLIEIAWTIIPIMILMFIAVPSFKLLFFQLNVPPADLTVKATSKQWFWSYSYPDNGGFEFDS